jgi:hypothetical protein
MGTFLTSPQGDILTESRHVSDKKWRYTPNRGGKRKRDFYTRLERVCRLGSPILLEFLRDDRVLRTAGFVRADMRSRANATEYWPYLHRMILAHNRSLRSSLVEHDPARLESKPGSAG